MYLQLPLNFDKFETNKKIIGKLTKRFITNHAQCSLLKLNNLFSVGVADSTPYRKAVAQVSQNERIVQINQN